ncbi:hypothetical protein BOX15_Mlig010306g1 [Macrostomum lignano]|uniref:Uncharacterized protein n=2 Tax=Macrostomum lignano TaxID=282301 RepID=A0A267FKH3_9PLAT|nr:hypothetical protein BOX15_Mlig010306g1 [Macrostomum lignano]
MNDTCERINTYGQSKSSFIIGYEGIPQNLLLNAVTSVILIIIFLIIRKVAWRYSQSALLDTSEESYLIKKQRNYNVWSQFFYGNLKRHHRASAVASTPSDDNRPGAQGNESSDASYSPNLLPESMSGAPESAGGGGGGRVGGGASNLQQDPGLFRSLKSFIQLTDEDIGSVAGKDAVRYIKLQRYIFVLLLVVLVLSLSIVLPLNIHGAFTDKVGDFSRTTISNIKGESFSLWVHGVLSAGYMLLAALFMCHYSRHVVSYDAYSVNPNCLMVKGVPERLLDEAVIMGHFREAYPNVLVEKVNFVYDTAKLQKLHDESIFISAVLQLCREEAEAAADAAAATGAASSSTTPIAEPPQVSVTKCRCTWLCGGCCCGTEDAVTYYADRLENISKRLTHEAEVSKSRKLPFIFVEFATPTDASHVLSDYQRAQGHLCGLLPFNRRGPARSVHSEVLQTDSWTVEYAPYPEDLNWHNLSHAASLVWYLRAAMINTGLVLLLFFFTTPVYFMTMLKLNRINDAFQRNVATQFLPTLFLWFFSAILPLIVYYSDLFIQHWTKSTEHYAIMIKCTLFQLLMVLILPSFGLSRADEFFKWIFSLNSNDSAFRLRWHCVFVSENASFFVNYVITTAMIGCCADLLRFSELINYAFHWFSARSSAEAKLAYKKVQWENQYGFNLSWMLCIFGIVMTYANVAPLILVFGILYMIMKMIVDRYNIHYVYLPSIMDRDVHRLSQSLVLVCVFLGEIFILGFFLIRIPGMSDARTVFMFVAVIISLAYIFGRLMVHMLRKAGCFGEQSFDLGCLENCDKTPYLPKVLLRPPGGSRSSGLPAEH